MTISRELFLRQRHRRFGNANPQRQHVELWEYLVRTGAHPHSFRQQLALDCGPEPDWCFERLGATLTDLPDGRTVCVAGEHEDYYDPDFCIYNDVVVLGPGDTVALYGYPEDVFPPTDFHTATLVGDRLLLIGSIGYQGRRTLGVTPVYSLDLASYRIDPVPTTGEPPGWIFKHAAALDPDGTSITVRGGELIQFHDAREINRLNSEDYRLHLKDGRWERITDRRYRLFLIERADRAFWFQDANTLDDAVFRPATVPHEVLPSPGYRVRLLRVNGIPVRLVEDLTRVQVIVEGPLPAVLARRLADDVAARLSWAVSCPCRVFAL